MMRDTGFRDIRIQMDHNHLTRLHPILNILITYTTLRYLIRSKLPKKDLNLKIFQRMKNDYFMGLIKTVLHLSYPATLMSKLLPLEGVKEWHMGKVYILVIFHPSPTSMELLFLCAGSCLEE